MDLRQLSNDSLICVLKRVDVDTITKIRKINKNISDFIDSRRNHVCSLFKKGFPLNLKIEISSKPKTEEKEEDEFEITFAVAQHNVDFKNILSMKSHKYLRIENPAKQLSSICFGNVFLDYDIANVGSTTEIISKNRRKQIEAFTKIFEHLKRFRLFCNYFIVHKKSENVPQFEEILRLISFIEIIYLGPCKIEEIEKWPLQKGSGSHIFYIYDVPPFLPNILHSMKYVTLQFEDNADETEVQQLTANFLLGITQNTSSKGRLKYVFFNFPGLSEPLLNFKGLITIWRGKDESGQVDVSVSKVAFDGGIAYILNYEGYDVILREEENDREAVQYFISTFQIQQEIGAKYFPGYSLYAFVDRTIRSLTG